MNTFNAILLNTTAAIIGMTAIFNLYPQKDDRLTAQNAIPAKGIEITVPSRAIFQPAMYLSYPPITKDKLILSPNPNNGYFIVHLPSGAVENKGIIEIIDLAGNKVYSAVLTADIGDKLDIDLTGKTSGMYFLVIITSNDRITERFVIQ